MPETTETAPNAAAETPTIQATETPSPNALDTAAAERADEAPAEKAPATPAETKPATEEAKPAAEPEAKDTEEAKPNAPEVYSLTAPEGFDGLPASIETLARANDMSNEVAQAVLDSFPAHYKAQADAFRSETEADPVYGGDKLEGHQKNALLVLDRFLPPDTPIGKQFRDGIDKTGYGNWKPLVALLSAIGETYKEDRPIDDSAVGRAPNQDAADMLYDNPQSRAAG